MIHSLKLPQTELTFKKSFQKTTLLMTAGGRPPENRWFSTLAAGLPIWCIDSGIHICRQTGITPDRIIGDGDSANPEAWAWGRSLGVPVEIYPEDKDYTDLQLALFRAKEIYGTTTAIITGVWGGRFDHAFGNIQSLAGSEALGIKSIAADESEVLFFLSGQDNVKIKAEVMPDVISLISLSNRCLGVTIAGVRWPLQNAELKRTLPYAISNQPLVNCQEVFVSLGEGLLGVYLQYKHL